MWDKRSYKRGAEDILDLLYYMFLKAGIKDSRVYEIIRKIQASIKEDKISELLNQLGLT